MSKQTGKFIAAGLIAILNVVGISGVGYTQAFYADTEISSGNVFRASLLDFSVSNLELSDRITVQTDNSVSHFSAFTQDADSLPIQYRAGVNMTGGQSEFCHALQLTAELDGSEFYSGGLLGFSIGTTTDMGDWDFHITLSGDVSSVRQGDVCQAELVFEGWRTDVSDYLSSGYHDIEKIDIDLVADMVVMNEFLPNPEGEAYGFDFGSDHDDLPQGEWIELYNNSAYPADLTGWYIEDEAGNKIDIEVVNTNLATTTIPATGWLVVYTNQAVLNNNGDTLGLYNASGTLVDGYSYAGGTYCEQEPSPSDANLDGATGSCDSVPPNKSYARIPDGIGDWIDPVPTPAAANTLDGELAVEDLMESADSQVESDDSVGSSTTSTATSTEGASSSTTPATSNDRSDDSSEDSEISKPSLKEESMKAEEETENLDQLDTDSDDDRDDEVEPEEVKVLPVKSATNEDGSADKESIKDEPRILEVKSVTDDDQGDLSSSDQDELIDDSEVVPIEDEDVGTVQVEEGASEAEGVGESRPEVGVKEDEPGELPVIEADE